jgi:hypothetical protein
MRTLKKTALASALLFAGLSPGASFAQMPQWEDTSVTIGLKTWVTNWNTWFSQTSTNGVPGVVPPTLVISNDVFNRKAESEVTFIPQLTLRNGPWLLSGSALAKKDFTFFLNNRGGLQELNEVTFERKEYDVNVGYAIAPGVAVTLGYKDLRYEGGSYKYNAKGPTIGISGSAPLAMGASMYGSIGYGRPKINEDAGTEKKRGSYLLTEIGLAYPLGQLNEGLKTTVVTAGYRYQRLSSGNVTSESFSVVNGQVGTSLGERAVELVDVTEGFTLGVSFTF